MQITTQQDIQQLGSILGIWAHPDDETWASAGIMAMAHTNGQSVACITATYGENGVQDTTRWPADHIPEIRKHELAAACEILGVKKSYYLGLRDGQCSAASHDAVERIKKIIDSVKPDTILTFGPSGSTGHPDHIAVSNWASSAVASIPRYARPAIYHSVHSKQWYERSGKKLDEQFNIFFKIDQPPLVDESAADIALKLSGEWCDIKLAALKAHTSQSSGFFESADQAMIKDIACFEGFMRVTRA
jgi:LmbE family N-acetylglucosaminyl deacetylase